MSKYFSFVAILAVMLLLGGCKGSEKPAEAPKTDSAAVKTEAPVDGETFTNEAAMVSVALPEGWFYEATENSMVAHSADSLFAVTFLILKADELDAAMAEVDKSLAADIKNLKMGEPKDEEINGMKGRYIEGTADGLEVYMALIDTPAENTTMFINAFAAPEALKKYEKELDFIFKNIKPVK